MIDYPAIDFKNVTQNIGNFSLSNISFSLPKGFIVCFVGRNGSGKTSLLKLSGGFNLNYHGIISILGEDIKCANIEVLQKNIGYSIADEIVYPYRRAKNVKEIVRSFYPSWDENYYQSLKRIFKIDDNLPIRELSTGERKKFYLLLAISHRPPLLLLDEPTSSIDDVSKEQIHNILRDFYLDGKHSVAFSTQDSNEVSQFADYLVYLKDGKAKYTGLVDNLLDFWIYVKGDKDLLEKMTLSPFPYLKVNAFSFEALLERKNQYLLSLFPSLQASRPTLVQIQSFWEEL
jgi:ABC-2 type transport system ATP-binding protein